MSDTAAPTGTPVASKPPAAPPVAAGAPVPVSTAKQATPPVHPSVAPVAEAGKSQDRIQAARAKMDAKSADDSKPVINPGEKPKEAQAQPAATTQLTQVAGGTSVPASGDDSAAEIDVAAVVERAKAADAARAAAVLPADADMADKAKRARALADKGDHLGAIKELGIDLDAAVKQKTNAPADGDPKDKEIAETRAENERLKAERDQYVAQVKLREEYDATVSQVIADPDFANLTKPGQVDAAFAEARKYAKIAAADIGRPLTPAEADRLVRHVLSEHNAKAAGGNPAEKTRETAPTIPGSRAGAAPTGKPRHRTAEEVRRTAFQPTRN
ncbi:MAG TPA: hypothetical protein VLZ78_07850 [Terrimesophilobacter sp.]|nr:hypothetical protein [Terrimesophilobacter sp.]